MRILITGGTGFIGSRLALRLLGKGHEVEALGRPGKAPDAEEASAAEIRAAGGAVRAVPLDDYETISPVVANRDVVFHLAATQHEMNVSDQAFRAVNVEALRILMQACSNANVSRFVHGSTIGVHGDGAPELISEDSALAPGNIYDVTKKEGEDVVRSLSDSMETVILRIGETYGPGDHRLLKLFRGIQKRRFFLIGKGSNLHQPIYVDDLLDAMLLAAEHPGAVGETMLMAGPEILSTRQMAEAVAQTVGIPLVPVRAPMSLLLAVAFILEKTLRPIGIQPPLHRRRMNFFRLNLTFSMDHAKDVLGYEPQIRFQEGAQLTAKWYRDTGLLD